MDLSIHKSIYIIKKTTENRFVVILRTYIIIYFVVVVKCSTIIGFMNELLVVC